MASIPKILIVEDDDTTRRVMLRTVEDEGCSAILSTNGRRALDILHDNPDIAMVITDMVMPEMGREEMIQLLRSDPRFTKLPIIIISGVVSIKEIEHLLKLGGSRFLPKPIDTSDLRLYIRKYLKGDAAETASV